MQRRHYESELDIFKLRPTKESDRFTELITFMSHVSPCYKEHGIKIATNLLDLMESNATTVHPSVRMKLLQALILLRNREMLDPLYLIKLSFKLFSIQDKTLRKSLYEYITNDIKTMNMNTHNDKLNRRVQALLFEILSEDKTVTSRKVVEILSELYRKRIWVDARTVNVIATACCNESARVMVAGLNFFLGIENKMLEDDEEENEKLLTNQTDEKDGKVSINYHEHSKKTRKKARVIKKQETKLSKLRKSLEEQKTEAIPLFPAIQLIHDPQNLAEKLFKRLRQSCEKFEVKLLLMNFISRLIGCHQLQLLSFYR